MKFATGLVVCAATVLIAQESVSVWDGIYVQEQAAQGKALYDKQCSPCHGDTLNGKSGPPLTGSAFRENWTGLTADDLFEYINKSMPRGKTGTLTREETANIVAYMLTSNGFPPGRKELPKEAAALQTIRIEAAKAK